jgi:hypothetical protein
LDLLQPVGSNKIKHSNKNELKMGKEIENDIKFESDTYHKQLDKEDSEWIYEP